MTGPQVILSIQDYNDLCELAQISYTEWYELDKEFNAQLRKQIHDLVEENHSLHRELATLNDELGKKKEAMNHKVSMNSNVIMGGSWSRILRDLPRTSKFRRYMELFFKHDKTIWHKEGENN